ncbi:hypothetical protein JHK82_052600 [Glycine max]|nr:hypothetical protein JHK86_052446 [Glycine max]KAG5082448.1 hypothetical protein JHK84_052486 [Glycine max]KAG5085203.1 hypothetical protein JHK82_052600 [Glycine max]
MAPLNCLYVVVAFVLSSNILIITSLSSETLPPSTEHSTEIYQVSRPLTTYEKYLRNCANKLKPNCAEEIFYSVFIGNQTIGKPCCFNLVTDMGLYCHVDITKYMIDVRMKKSSMNTAPNGTNEWVPSTRRSITVDWVCGKVDTTVSVSVTAVWVRVLADTG